MSLWQAETETKAAFLDWFGWLWVGAEALMVSLLLTLAIGWGISTVGAGGWPFDLLQGLYPLAPVLACVLGAFLVRLLNGPAEGSVQDMPAMVGTLLGLTGFAALTYWDITSGAGVYSQWLPHALGSGTLPWVWGLPAAGLGGWVLLPCVGRLLGF